MSSLHGVFKCDKNFAVLFSFSFFLVLPSPLTLLLQGGSTFALWSSPPQISSATTFGHEGAHQGFIGGCGPSAMPKEKVGEGNLL